MNDEFFAFRARVFKHIAQNRFRLRAQFCVAARQSRVNRVQAFSQIVFLFFLYLFVHVPDSAVCYFPHKEDMACVVFSYLKPKALIASALFLLGSFLVLVYKRYTKISLFISYFMLIFFPHVILIVIMTSKYDLDGILEISFRNKETGILTLGSAIISLICAIIIVLLPK